jgi:hypothetical protein
VIEEFAGVTLSEERCVAFPVPLSEIVNGLPSAVNGIVSVPERVPIAVGVNATPIAHVSPASTPAAHVFDTTAKSPFVTGVETERVESKWFVNVTVFAAVVSPTVVLANVKDVVGVVTDADPVPDNPIVWGLFAALSVNVSAPARPPVAVGEKVTPTLHVAPAATLALQVLPATVKSPLARMFENVTLVFSWFVSVTDLTSLVLPSATVPKSKLLGEMVTGVVPVPVMAVV